MKDNELKFENSVQAIEFLLNPVSPLEAKQDASMAYVYAVTTFLSRETSTDLSRAEHELIRMAEKQAKNDPSNKALQLKLEHMYALCPRVKRKENVVKFSLGSED
jgi:hypothetical protein